MAVLASMCDCEVDSSWSSRWTEAARRSRSSYRGLASSGSPSRYLRAGTNTSGLPAGVVGAHRHLAGVGEISIGGQRARALNVHERALLRCVVHGDCQRAAPTGPAGHGLITGAIGQPPDVSTTRLRPSSG